MENTLEVIMGRLDQMSREELEALNRLLDLAEAQMGAQPESRRSDPAPAPEQAREEI